MITRLLFIVRIFSCLGNATQNVAIPAGYNLFHQLFQRAVPQVHACDGELNLQAGSGTSQEARYLCFPYTFNGSHNSEIEKQLVAAKLGGVAWASLGHFWS